MARELVTLLFSQRTVIPNYDNNAAWLATLRAISIAFCDGEACDSVSVTPGALLFRPALSTRAERIMSQKGKLKARGEPFSPSVN